MYSCRVRTSPKVKKDIGYVLRIYRAERNLSQFSAAKKFDVSPAHWSMLEDGKRRASPGLAKDLADATGAPLELFLGLIKTWDGAK